MSRISVVLISILALSGCKLAVIVVEGGEVQSTASGTCAVISPGINGNVCIHEITDTSYNETFTAVAGTGFEFDRWSTGGDFFCADSTNPVCALSNGIGAGNPDIESIIASDKMYYLMPIFKPLPPPTDTVMADGLEWAQPILFVGSTHAEIQAVCAGGPCNGYLNDLDVTGWNWASGAEVAQMFYNEYGLGDGTLNSSILGQCSAVVDLLLLPYGVGTPPKYYGEWHYDYALVNIYGEPYVLVGLAGATRDTSEPFYLSSFLGGYYNTCFAGTPENPLYSSTHTSGVDSGAWIYRVP
jgi:hypothetical protein